MGNDKKALIVLSAILIAAIALIAAMVAVTPRDEKYIAPSETENFIDVIALENGEWLYATSAGTVSRMKNGEEKDSFNAVSLVAEKNGFERGILRKVYKSPLGDSLWGVVSATDVTSRFLFCGKFTESGFTLTGSTLFDGNVDNLYFVENGGFLFVACTGNGIATLMKYNASDISGGVTDRTYLYDCSPVGGKIRLKAVQMANGIDCFDSDGKYLYILYDGGFMRISTDFSDVIYKGTSKNYTVDELDTSKYISFGFSEVNSRGGAFIEEDGRFYVVDRSTNLYTFETSAIDSLKIGESLTLGVVPNVAFPKSPQAHKAMFYSPVTKEAYVLHESDSAATRVNLSSQKIDFTFNLNFNISNIIQGESADDVYYLYKNVNETGQAEKNVLAHINIALKRNEGVIRGFMIAGICIAVVTAIVLIVLGVIVARGKQAQALKVLAKVRRQKFIYIAMIPSLILLATFCYYEAIASIGLSFFDYTLQKPTMLWNNFNNYKKVFTSDAVEAFGNMILFLGFDIVVAIIPPLIFAFFLTVMKSEKFSNLVRTLLFLTGVVPGIAGLLIWKTGIYSGEGVINLIIKACGGSPISFLGQTAYAKWAILFIGFPFVGSYLIFYGGMMNIPSSYYEAAELEGIGIWKRLFCIDIPLIVPQLKYVFITSFIHSLQNFARTDMLTKGQFGTNTPIYKMYVALTQDHDYGLASAYATVIFVFLFFATFLNLRKQKKSLED